MNHYSVNTLQLIKVSSCLVNITAQQKLFDFVLLSFRRSPGWRMSLKIFMAETSRCTVSVFLTHHYPLVFISKHGSPLCALRTSSLHTAYGRLSWTVRAIGSIWANILAAVLAKLARIIIRPTK